MKAIILLGGVGATGLTLWLMTRKAEAHPGNIMLESLTVTPPEVYTGEQVEVSVLATNIGEEKATKEITCEVL